MLMFNLLYICMFKNEENMYVNKKHIVGLDLKYVK